MFEVVDPSTGVPATLHESLEEAIETARKLPESWYIAMTETGDIVWTDVNEYRK